MRKIEGMVPLWTNRLSRIPHLGGYQPPLEACIKFVVRGSVTGINPPFILTGYTTSIKGKTPEGMEFVTDPVVITGPSDCPKVYMLYEIHCWQLHECEEGRFGTLRQAEW